MPKDELIERLETATGPDRELDAAIDMVRLNLRGTPAAPVYFDGHDKGHWRDTVGLLRTAPAYTASIDAALTLLPEGWGFMSLGADPYEQEAFCVTIYERRHWNRHREWPEGSITTGYSFATPALAICIAALHATERGEAGR